MYYIPKMRKNPTGVRFISASTKQISKCFTNVFKLVYSQMENFHKNDKFLSNYDRFWVLQNSDPIIQSLNSMNKKSVSNLLQHMTFQNYTQSYLMAN